MFGIEGKVIVITGATGYLGREMVSMLAQAGAIIAITARDIAKAKNLAQKKWSD